VNIAGFEMNFSKDLCQAGVPFFESVERALTIYAQARQYQRWKEHRST